MRTDFVALYVDPRGPYPALLGPERCWDVTRDARLYDGPHPVVAHPPCGPYSKQRHNYRGSEHDCAPRALEQVRKFGGALEHPAGSKFWEEVGLPGPIGSDLPSFGDRFGRLHVCGGAGGVGTPGAQAHVGLCRRRLLVSRARRARPAAVSWAPTNALVQRQPPQQGRRQRAAWYQDLLCSAASPYSCRFCPIPFEPSR